MSQNEPPHMVQHPHVGMVQHPHAGQIQSPHAGQCHDCRTERDIATEGRLARMEAKLEAIDEKLDDAVLAQLKDHGKRITAIERRWWLLMGYMAGSGLIGAAAVRIFM